MTENKQFKLKIIGDINDVDSEIILKDGGQPLCEFISIEDARLVRDLLNALHEENTDLKIMLNQCRDQRNEFHRGARENANRVGKLEKENEQLKQSVNNLKETILKITIAYQRKHDNTIVNLVDEVHEEDITDLIKELKE